MTDKIKHITVCVLMAIFLLVMSAVCILKPDNEISKTERRKLAQRPKLSPETVLSGKYMESFEDYAKDQFPFREDFRTIKALASTKLLGKWDNNGIYVVDVYASALEYPLSTDSINNAIDKFKFVYDRYISDKNMDVYFSIIPDKNYFLAEANGYPFMEYEEMFTRMQEGLPEMEYIGITDSLDIEDYYMTDSHWKQECIIDTANVLKECMGVETVGDYDVISVETPFHGVYSGQSALNLKPDTIKYVNNEFIENYIVYDYEHGRQIPVYDMEKIVSDDSYEMYLGGPLSLVTIENPMAESEKELIIFRDSFGSSIAPLLAEGYKKVTLVDIRYLRSDMLDRFIEFDNQDVLFLYSTMVLNNSEMLK